MVCWVRSCHKDHVWVKCPLLAGIREKRGKDWKPSAADRAEAERIMELRAVRSVFAATVGEEEAAASLARAGVSTASLGDTLAPLGSQRGAQGPPAASASASFVGVDPGLVPRPVRLGPRIQLELVGDPRQGPHPQAASSRSSGGQEPAVL